MKNESETTLQDIMRAILWKSESDDSSTVEMLMNHLCAAWIIERGSIAPIMEASNDPGGKMDKLVQQILSSPVDLDWVGAEIEAWQSSASTAQDLLQLAECLRGKLTTMMTGIVGAENTDG